MGRREVKNNNFLFRYWIWDFPEIKPEIESLFADAGKAKILEDEENSLKIELELHNPIVIARSNTVADGIMINTSTYACVGTRPSVRVYRLPKKGDKSIIFFINLELETLIEYKTLTSDDLRQAIKNVASMMTKTWYLS